MMKGATTTLKRFRCQNLGGELLCQSLTQQILKIRILGKSLNATPPCTRNPTLFPPWPALQMPTTHESLKNCILQPLSETKKDPRGE
jgi:hypothetical protein